MLFRLGYDGSRCDNRRRYDANQHICWRGQRRIRGNSELPFPYCGFHGNTMRWKSQLKLVHTSRMNFERKESEARAHAGHAHR